MKKYLNKYLTYLYNSANIQNLENVIKAIQNYGPFESILDFGCWEGKKSVLYKEAAKAKKVYGIEPVEAAVEEAKKKGVLAYAIKGDQGKWPLKDASVDCIVSDQVVEHLTDLDVFFAEAWRVLKPNGIFITSTNNLSSPQNIFSILMGWAPFDLTNSSYKKWSIGNPLAIHNNQDFPAHGSTWIHKCVYTPYWLGKWKELYGFEVKDYYGAGLYPFPKLYFKFLRRYCAFFTLIVQKPEKSD